MIEIDLVDQDGGTLVRMTHSGLPDTEQCASHEKGWTHYLARLAIAAAGGDPGPDLRRARRSDRRRCACFAGCRPLPSGSGRRAAFARVHREGRPAA